MLLPTVLQSSSYFEEQKSVDTLKTHLVLVKIFGNPALLKVVILIYPIQVRHEKLLNN